MYSERDRKIFDRINNGENRADIAKELCLTPERIRYIYEKVKSHEMHEDELRDFCDMFYNGNDRHTCSRVYSILKRNGINTVSEFKNIKIEDIARFGYIGPKSIQYIKQMKDYLTFSETKTIRQTLKEPIILDDDYYTKDELTLLKKILDIPEEATEIVIRDFDLSYFVPDK